MSAGVVIEGVSLAYGPVQVLRDVSLEIRPGEFFAFLGPSGSGKTTLLRLIAGFGRAQAGRVLIGGRDVTGVPPWRRNVGMVFQNYALWPHMSVWRNVAFGLEERRLPRAEVARRAEAALDLVGLGGYGARRPSQLSGGQQQRVALARTIVVEPEVLLLDEPLSNLDAKLRVQMRGELRDLQRKLGTTAVYVTHDQEEANTIADRIAVLDGGVIQQLGTPIELYDRPANRFVAQFLGTANLIEGRVRGGAFEGAGGIRVPLGAPAEEGPAGLVLRPHHLLVRRKNEPAPAGAGRLEGVVRGREFLGSAVRYRVEAGGALLLADGPHRRGEVPLVPGEGVALCFEPDQAILLPG
ncbi:MAG: ABC transporter ATP-binding protein [Candidatus Tectomicrobia bacterium]|uniref:ABC transporter ATP-binding protein n=1 Tax=Tectimicrobiota bacterium TaxID=2528274 RepID=A0A932I3D9_UNCTE|nr:ABC transporter ATP-binding protein [Candidatus Tectomicrobia bacterium]